MVLLLGLTILIAWVLPMPTYRSFLGEALFTQRPGSAFAITSFIVSWAIPGLAAGALTWRHDLATRASKGLPLLAFGVVFYFALYAARIASGLVEGGGGRYALDTMVTGYLALPLKVVLLIGVAQVLINLNTSQPAE